jgi:hypothetical protein
MVRSAAATLAVLILPTFALGQQAPGTHTVVRDDTLWDLAQRYYGNPFEWRVIWNANTDVVEDPNWIYPNEVLVIPGLPGQAPAEEEQPTAAIEPAEPPQPSQVPPDMIPFGLRAARPVVEGTRTIFYAGEDREAGSVTGAAVPEYAAVSADRVHSAPWLIGLAEEPDATGHIAGFAERGQRASAIRSFDRVRIEMPSPARVGANLQLFRVDRTIENVGHVVIPTGVATVSVIGNGAVVAEVVKEYHRIQPGDLVRPLPMYTATPGVYAEEIAGGSEAMIMGFAGNHVLTDIGHVAFLDLGSDDGIVIGDEFVLYGEAIPTARDGSLQVIGVTETTAAARVLSMRDNVFRQGVVVRLAKKMR